MAFLSIYPSQAPQSYPPYRGIGDFGVIASPKIPKKEGFGDFGVIAKRGAVKPKTDSFLERKGGPDLPQRCAGRLQAEDARPPGCLSR